MEYTQIQSAIDFCSNWHELHQTFSSDFIVFILFLFIIFFFGYFISRFSVYTHNLAIIRLLDANITNKEKLSHIQDHIINYESRFFNI